MAQKPTSTPVRSLLTKLEGEWVATVKMPAMGSAPARTSEGEASGKLILGGRYARLAIALPMMGQATHHEVTLGHDDFKRHFDFTWLSDQSTATVRATGKADASVITFHGDMDDAMAGKRKVRHVFAFDEAGFSFTTFDTLPTGEELEIMTVSFTPAKAGK